MPCMYGHGREVRRGLNEARYVRTKPRDRVRPVHALHVRMQSEGTVCPVHDLQVRTWPRGKAWWPTRG